MAKADIPMTQPVREVLAALISNPTADHHAIEVHKATGLPLRSVYPVFVRLEALQWLDSGWEPLAGPGQPKPEQGWPRRRWYRLSAQGLAMARGALASARANNAEPSRWRAAGELA
ncbi:MAG: PadR family transcriptional regulator [Nakamurella sp.]